MHQKNAHRRTRAGFLAAAVLVLPAGGCAPDARSGNFPADEPRTPPIGGTFHLMLEAPGTLDPSRVDDVYEACLVNQIFDGLLEFDANLNPVPCIAREWNVTRGGTLYEFRLRDDVRFHNGRPLVAADVVYSLSRILDPDREDPGLSGEFLRKIRGASDFRAGRADSISGVRAPSDHVLVIELEAPYASFLAALAMDQTKIVAREEIEREDAGLQAACGTGPFFLDRVEDDPADPRYVLSANPDYFRGRAYLDQVVMHVPRDYNMDRGAQAALDGVLSLSDFPGSLEPEFRSDSRFRLIRRPEMSCSFIGLNVSEGPLRDVRVRQALAHAIDATRIAGLDPAGRVSAEGILPPGMFGYSPLRKSLAHDPERARALLSEAGYPDGEGLGPIRLWQADRGELGRHADEIVREELAAVGVRVEFLYAEWDEFDRRLTDLELPAFGLTWVADLPDPDSFLATLFSGSSASNLFAFADAEVDSLLQVGGSLPGSLDRAELYRRVERRILEEAPIIPLFFLANNFAVRAEFRDLPITPFGLGNLALERVWIEASSS